MKKYLFLGLALFLLFPSRVNAGTATRYFTYGVVSEVTNVNLNGNFDNLKDVINGELDNDNADTSSGFRFYETLSSLPSASTDGRLVHDKSDDSLRLDNGSSFLFIGPSEFFVGEASRSSSTASGTQTVSGVGFTPTAVIIFAVQLNADEASWGFSTVTNNKSIARNEATYTGRANQSIWDFQTSGNTYGGVITSFNSDGFVITWTRTGTPTGTINFYFIAYK